MEKYCKRVEFPINIVDFGESCTINSENVEDFQSEVLDVINENAKFVIRCFPFKRQGIEGEIYIFVYIDQSGEYWNRINWAKYHYIEKHPLAKIPNVPDNLICFHGIAINENEYNRSSFTSRLDLRENKYKPNLSRQSVMLRKERNNSQSMLINEIMCEILEDHIKNSYSSRKRGWQYIQSLISNFPGLELWNTYDKAIMYYINGKEKITSLNKLNTLNKITFLIKAENYTLVNKPQTNDFPLSEYKMAVITENEIGYFSEEHIKAIIEKRLISKVDYLENSIFAVEWLLSEELSFFGEKNDDRMFLVNISNDDIIGHNVIKINQTKNQIVLNNNNIFVQWLTRLKKVNEYKDIYKRVISLLKDPLKYQGSKINKLNTFLQNWDKNNLIEANLPPLINLTESMFYAPGSYEQRFQNIITIKKSIKTN